MDKRRMVLGVGVIVVVLALGASLGYAQATRTWVSGVGDDANPCSRTAPCKTFAGAISKTLAGGVINVLDPGGFGALTITKALTIDGSGTYGGVLVSGTSGIVVSAGSSDDVVLRGLSFEGVGTGVDGILFNSGASLTVENCTINNFDTATSVGIAFQPTTPATLFVRDTIIRDMGWGGILVKPANSTTTKASIDRVRIETGVFGVRAEAFASIAINDSTVTGNVNHGFIATSSTNPAEINAERCVVTGNTGNGVTVTGSVATVRLSNNIITDNGTGLSVGAGGTIISFGNNVIEGNTTDGSPTSVHSRR